MMPIQELIAKCRTFGPLGTRPSAEETMALIGEIERLRTLLERARPFVEHAVEHATIEHDVELTHKQGGTP